jgi:hypothetical protein
MGFLAPAFLAGLAALGLPVYLHLLRRHKAPPLPFSSLMFFERRTQASVKHRRLQYLVLLALRMALVALVALAFAGPFVRRPAALVSSGQPLVVLAVDNSFSMRAGGRLEQAKSEAEKMVGRIGPGGRAQVVAYGSAAHLMCDSTGDRAALVGALRAIEPGDGRTSFAEFSRSLRALAQSSQAPVEAHLFSDMQQSGMPANFADLELPENVRLVTHPVGGAAAANYAVENVLAPRRVYSARKVRVQAAIAGYGAARAKKRVSLLIDNRVIETKEVDVPADGRAAVEFLSLEAPYGLNRGAVRIEGGDALAADDVYYFSIERAEPRHALFLHQAGQTRALGYFRAALEASAENAFLLDAALPDSAGAVSPARYAFVVISDLGALPAPLEREMEAYLRAGGSVLLLLGRSAYGRGTVPLAGLRILESHYAGREAERFQTATGLDGSHPALSGDTHWDGVKFFHAVRVEAAGARVAARLADDTPLLIDKQAGAGRILVFASTFDNVSNDLPLHPAFVPFAVGAARYLARMDDSRSGYLVDAWLDLRDAEDKGSAVDVVDPDGRRALSLGEAARAENIRLTRAGYWEIRRPNGRNELAAVNADRRESDLRPAADDALALWRHTGREDAPAGGARGPAGTATVSLWWYVMAAAAALALAESLWGNRYLGVDREAV